MTPARRLVTWLRTADAPVPRSVRSMRRSAARAQARRQHGSIAAHMAAVVAEANAGSQDPAGTRRPRPRRR